MDLRKYHLAQVNAAQHSIEFHKTAIASLEGDTNEETASEPANGAVARQAAARTAAAKAKPAATKAAAKEEETTEDDGLDFLGEGAEEAAGVTEDDVKTAIKKFVAAFGKDKVVGLLGKFKAKAVQDIKAKDYDQFIALVDSALKKYKK
jgi:hypothetical protein